MKGQRKDRLSWNRALVRINDFLQDLASAGIVEVDLLLLESGEVAADFGDVQSRHDAKQQDF